MVDVQRPPTIALTDREMAIIGHALGMRKTDLICLRNLCEQTGDLAGQTRIGHEMLELDLVRLKLGFMGEDER